MLPLLIGDRDIVLGLPRGGDAQIQRGTQRHGHRDCPLRSSARPKQLIEEIAEPCLEYVELGVGDRHALGPIVGNGPACEVLFRRPTDARPRTRDNVKIIRQHAAFGAATR
jgi:hypothetical protein